MINLGIEEFRNCKLRIIQFAKSPNPPIPKFLNSHYALEFFL